MIDIGRIIGTTSLRRYLFAISNGKEHLVKKDDFASVVEPITSQEVIGIIRDITINNQMLPDEFARESTKLDEYLKLYDFNEGEHIVAVVDILGCFDKNLKNEFRLPKYALRPGSKVFLTSDKLLKELTLVNTNNALYIGDIESRSSVPVYLEANRLVSMHCAILAMTGAGKSYATGVLIEELIKKNAAIVVFDPHGEYCCLTRNPDDSFSDICDKIKIFGISENAENKLRLRANSLNSEDIASFMPGITETQRHVLYEVINICRNTKRDYTLMDLIEVLHMFLEGKNEKEVVINSEFEKKILTIAKKTPISTINAMIRRLDILNRSAIIDENETKLEEIVKPGQISIVDLSGISENIREIVVSAISRRIFLARMNFVSVNSNSSMHINNHAIETLDIPCFLIIEEAHNFAPREVERIIVSRTILRRIAREGRKFGVGLCIVSQRPSRLDQDVLSQCNTQIVMRIVNPIDQDYIRKSAESITDDIINDLPSLARGEAIVCGSAVNCPMHIKIRKRETKCGGPNLDIVNAWEEKVKEEN